MEPMDAYCPAADCLHNNPETDHRFYKWMYQREVGLAFNLGANRV
jgi:hypothetical protein